MNDKKFRYIEDADIDHGVELFLRQGLVGEEVDEAMDLYLEGLNAKRSKTEGPNVFLKAAQPAAMQLGADVMRTAGSLSKLTKPLRERFLPLPEGTPPLDVMGEDAAKHWEEQKIPEWERDAQQAAAGSLKEGSTWLATMGGMAPLMATTLASEVLGKGATAAKRAITLSVMMSSEKGNFQRTAQQYGVDEDISRTVGSYVGLVNGAVELPQELVMMLPFLNSIGKKGKEAAKKAMQPLTQNVIKLLIKKLGMEAAIAAGNAGEEGVQTLVFNKGMEYALRKMRDRYGSKWQPTIPYEKQDEMRAVLTGLGMSPIMRTSMSVVSAPYRYKQRKILYRKAIEAQSEKTFKDIEAGVPLEKPKEKISLAPPMFREERAEAAGKGVTIGPSKVAEGEWVDSRGEGPRWEKVEHPAPAPAPTKTKDGTSISDVYAEAAAIHKKVTGVEGTGFVNTMHTIMENQIAKHGGLEDVVPAPDRVLIIEKPQVDAVPEEEVTWGRRIDSFTSRVLKALATVDSKTKASMLFTMKKKALMDAGLSEDMAVHPELNDLRKGLKVEVVEKLTRPQYIKYTDSMEGQSRSLLSREFGEKALINVDPRLFLNYKPMPIYDDSGNIVNYPTVKEMPTISLARHTLRPFIHMFNKLENLTGLRFLDLDTGVQTRHQQEMAARHNITLARLHLMNKVPTVWVRGTRRGFYHDLVTYLGTGPDERAQLVRQLNEQERQRGSSKRYRNTDTDMAQRYLDRANDIPLPFGFGRLDKVSTKDVLAKAKDTSAGFKTIYGWFKTQGIMDYDKFVTKYVPIVAKLHKALDSKDAMGNRVTWEGLIRRNERDIRKQFGISPEDIEELIDMGDVNASLKRKGMIVGGEKTPSFEHQRESDLGWLREVGRETDSEALLSLYTQQFMKKAYFQDMAPSIRAWMSNAETALSKEGMSTDAFRQIMSNYLDQVQGIPDNASRLWRNTNLISTDYMVGALIHNGFKLWNKNLGTMIELPSEVTLRDVSSFVTNFAFASTLGVVRFSGLNPMSPIKNVATQNIMSAIFGISTYIHGLIDCANPEVLAKLKSLDIRSEFPIPDYDRFSGRGKFKYMMEMTLEMFRLSDMVNAYSAGAGALHAFSRLHSEFARDPKLNHMTLEQFSKIVWGGKTPKQLGFDEQAIMENTGRISFGEKMKNTAPRGVRGITYELWSRIKEGRIEDAERMLVKFAVHTTQWRYGSGGTSHFLTSDALRPFTMYMTWPLNYMEYTTWLANPKNQMFQRWAGIMLGQFAAVSMFALLGFKNVYKWIGAGPIPEGIGFTGPVVQQVVNPIIAAAKAGMEASVVQVMPVSDEEEEKAEEEFRKRLEALFPNDE